MSEHKCNGCGALCTVQPSGPGKAEIFHPEPLCDHVLGLINGGVTLGAVRPARRDNATGEVVDDPEAVN